MLFNPCSPLFCAGKKAEGKNPPGESRDELLSLYLISSDGTSVIPPDPLGALYHLCTIKLVVVFDPVFGEWFGLKVIRYPIHADARI